METKPTKDRHTSRSVLIGGQVCRYVVEPDADWTGDGWRDETQVFLEIHGATIATWIGEWCPPHVVLGVVDGHSGLVDTDTGEAIEADEFGICEPLAIPFADIPDPEDLEEAP